ncbi:MAG TPA: hypothetical protein VIZ18_11710 [Ktedonobacteraceae bacterium]
MQSSPVRVESVNVGRPREVLWKGRKVLTGIFKEPGAAALPSGSSIWKGISRQT